VASLVKILKPIADGILYLESDNTRINEVFHYVFLIYKFTIDLDVYEKILDLFLARKDMLIKPVHLAAYLLDPKYKGEDLSFEEAVIQPSL
jgi:hypothetical protein